MYCTGSWFYRASDALSIRGWKIYMLARKKHAMAVDGRGDAGLSLELCIRVLKELWRGKAHYLPHGYK
jgi:hypothetical protein